MFSSSEIYKSNILFKFSVLNETQLNMKRYNEIKIFEMLTWNYSFGQDIFQLRAFAQVQSKHLPEVMRKQLRVNLSVGVVK